MLTPSPAEYWNNKKGYAPNWYSFMATLISERVTGSQDLFPVYWAFERCNLPVGTLLEVGCLEGDKLVLLQSKGLAQTYVGLDIADRAIERGKAKHGDRVELFVMDLNTPSLPRARYSVISANGVLHHIDNLEICAQALYDALEPGGYLFASEFTGPRRYEYSRKEIRLIREGQQMLPMGLQGEPFDPTQLRPKLDADPSESVRTRDIEPILRATFDEVLVRPFGGNVLMRALTHNFFDAFSPESAEHADALRRLIEFDTHVYASEPSHHCYFVASKH